MQRGSELDLVHLGAGRDPRCPWKCGLLAAPQTARQSTQNRNPACCFRAQPEGLNHSAPGALEHESGTPLCSAGLAGLTVLPPVAQGFPASQVSSHKEEEKVNQQQHPCASSATHTPPCLGLCSPGQFHHSSATLKLPSDYEMQPEN